MYEGGKMKLNAVPSVKLAKRKVGLKRKVMKRGTKTQ